MRYDSIYLTSWRRLNYKARKADQQLPEIQDLGVWRRVDCQEAREIFGVMEVFYIVITV